MSFGFNMAIIWHKDTGLITDLRGTTGFSTGPTPFLSLCTRLGSNICSSSSKSQDVLKCQYSIQYSPVTDDLLLYIWHYSMPSINMSLLPSACCIYPEDFPLKEKQTVTSKTCNCFKIERANSRQLIKEMPWSLFVLFFPLFKYLFIFYIGLVISVFLQRILCCWGWEAFLFLFLKCFFCSKWTKFVWN